MNNSSRRAVARTLNFSIIILETYATILAAINYGWGMFRFFTELSNILALITSLAYIVCSFLNTFPAWLKVLKLFSAVSLSITFFVVVCVLCPLSGSMGAQFMLFFGSMFFHHLVCPIVFVVSFLFFEPHYALKPTDTILSIFPALTYGVVIIILNILKLIVGPYQFLYIYQQSVWVTLAWCVIIGLLGAGAGFIFYLIKRRPSIPARPN